MKIMDMYLINPSPFSDLGFWFLKSLVFTASRWVTLQVPVIWYWVALHAMLWWLFMQCFVLVLLQVKNTLYCWPSEILHLQLYSKIIANHSCTSKICTSNAGFLIIVFKCIAWLISKITMTETYSQNVPIFECFIY